MNSPLLSSLSFRNGRTSPNRIWLAPLTNQQSHPDGTLSDQELHWLKARSAGGFGVIESCATHVSLDGQGWPGELGIFDDALIPGWQLLSEEIHRDDALLIAQIFHGGARALPSEEHRAPWSSSPTDDANHPARPGTDEDIESTIEAFAAAACRLHRAGGDGVEIHGAHGYLLSQFLSATLNQRTDQWGGPLENRARLIRRVLQTIRARIPEDFIVGVRLSPENYGNLQGLDLDESLQVARWLCEDGADFIHLSLWDASQNSTKYPHLHPARYFRDRLPEAVPLITAGKIWTVDDALAQLAHGADAVALGRSAIANPAWPRRVVADGEDPGRPPLTPEELRERALSPTFIDYMRRWPGFVTETS